MNCCQKTAPILILAGLGAGIGTLAAFIVKAPLLAGALPAVISGLFATAVLACIPEKKQTGFVGFSVVILSLAVGYGATLGLFALAGIAVNPLTLLIVMAITLGLELALATPLVCSWCSMVAGASVVAGEAQVSS